MTLEICTKLSQIFQLALSWYTLSVLKSVQDKIEIGIGIGFARRGSIEIASFTSFGSHTFLLFQLFKFVYLYLPIT